MRLSSAGLLATISLLFACTGPAEQGATSGNPQLAPFPYTAEEIRASNPPGTVLVYRIDENGVRYHMIFEFGETDGETVDLASGATSEEGQPLGGESQASRVSWRELRDHASFEAKNTERVEVSVSVVAGEFDCWLYTVHQAEPSRVTRYWFAKQRPGSPVLFTMEAAGRETYRMELLEAR